MSSNSKRKRSSEENDVQNYLENDEDVIDLTGVEGYSDHGGSVIDLTDLVEDLDASPVADIIPEDEELADSSVIELPQDVYEEVQEEDYDTPFDINNEPYLLEFLPPADPSKTSKAFLFLRDSYPDLSEDFLKTKAKDIGEDEGKLWEVVSQISSCDQSTLPTRVKEKRTVEEVLKMKPSDFLSEFSPSPHHHFSSRDRRDGDVESYHLDCYHYLGRRCSEVKGGLNTVKAVLRKNKNLLCPSFKELDLLPKTVNKKRVKRDPSRLSSRPFNVDFVTELVYLHLEERISAYSRQLAEKRRKAVDAARRAGGGGLFQCPDCGSGDNLRSEAVLCNLGCPVCRDCIGRTSQSVATRGGSTVFCPCGEGEFSLETLASLLPARIHSKIVRAVRVKEMRAAGYEIEKCPACQTELPVLNPDQDILSCEEPDCFKKFCKLCRKVDHSPMPCTSTKTNMRPSRNINEDDPMEARFRSFESHFYRMMAGLGGVLAIKSIDIIDNPWMKRAFKRKQQEYREKGVPSEPIFAYHGTRKDLIELIVNKNFDLSKAQRQAHGRGNYFSEYPKTALTYSDDKRHLILAQILPGKSYKGSNMQWPGFNSKLVQPASEGYSQMVIIEDNRQILPVAVINL